MTDLPNAPASVRNRDAILQLLKRELKHREKLLEIGSGTGQHAVYFARAMPGVVWQTSDVGGNLDAIDGRISEEGSDNVRRPLLLDVNDADAHSEEYSAVFTANTAHIMSEDSVQAMSELVGRVLRANGKFVVYGPFRVDGEFSTESNRQFDFSLRAQDQNMGIRDIEWLDGLLLLQGLSRLRTYAMPANNLLAVWARTD